MALMKALEFETAVAADQTLVLPQEAAAEVRPGMTLRVLLLIPDRPKNDWYQMSAEQFLSGYAESDAIYDEL